MIIDAYTHIAPPAFTKAMSRLVPDTDMVGRILKVRQLHDLDLRFKAMDRIPDYRQVIASVTPPVETFTTVPQGVALTEAANDAMAELVVRHPERFPAFIAALPMHSVSAAVDEIHRAIRKLGARGIQVFTNVNGKPLDDPEYAPIFEAMAGHDLPIWMHPARTSSMTDYSAEPKSKLEMWWLFGWPYETSVAMTRLAISGLFDRHPNLKILTHHLGGMVPFFDKRIEHGLSVLGARTPDEDYSNTLKGLKRPLIEYLRLFHADTALSGDSGGLACGLKFFGAERIVFATDAPFGPLIETHEAITKLEVPPEHKRAIFHENVQRLLKLSVH
jgi:predicted TIM-barrel fold metal-dependent hydrolase